MLAPSSAEHRCLTIPFHKCAPSVLGYLLLHNQPSQNSADSNGSDILSSLPLLGVDWALLGSFCLRSGWAHAAVRLWL